MENLKKNRIDQALVDQSLVKSRSHAQKKIEAGCVFVRRNGKLIPIQKSSEILEPEDEIIVQANDLDLFVSKGGLKLRAACEHLKLNISGLYCLDIGISTGGFTDFLLQNGAKKIVGLDVGQGQLDSKIGDNPQVTHIEKVNCRHADQLATALSEEKFDLIVMDVSFISATLIYPNLRKYLKENGKLLSLVKPQFELSPDALNRKGLVKSTKFYPAVEKKIKENLHNSGFQVLDYFQSSELGGDGNVEFFVFAK
ncbi:MAG: TlyA family RNA methyltransferase [Pseudobdellovibrionaceae bacterium]